MNIGYISIYLDLRLLSSLFFSFPHVALIHILLGLYLFHFFDANLNGIVLLVLNSKLFIVGM